MEGIVTSTTEQLYYTIQRQITLTQMQVIDQFDDALYIFISVIYFLIDIEIRIPEFILKMHA